jgi:hypothetical protein
MQRMQGDFAEEIRGRNPISGGRKAARDASFKE